MPTVELDIDGPAAPPRANGEIVFAEPWQSRAFGLVMALSDSGAIEWEDFRTKLIREISQWEASNSPGDCFNYYACWLAALEAVCVDRSLVPEASLGERQDELLARPAGYDHDHDHDHDH